MSLGPLDLYGTFAQSTTPFLFCCSPFRHPRGTNPSTPRFHLGGNDRRFRTKNAQKGKKGSIGGREKRTGPFLPFFRDLRERGRGRSISPTPCFWDKGYSPCSASCRRCGVFSESESRTRTGIGSGGLNDHKHRRRAKSIGRAGERERFQIA